MNRSSGMLAATCAYVLWGVLPIYWKLLQTVPALEILCHRMVWSLIFTLGLVLALGRGRALLAAATNPVHLRLYASSSLLLAVNWLIYIWAVNIGFILEASLGYFINPLISVLFGVIFFRERLRLGQVLALVLVVGGVVWLTIFYGRFPWIALVLSTSFAVYGLLHKKAELPALDGLCLETLIFFLPAAGFLLQAHLSGSGAFLHAGMGQSLLLAAAGLITSVPLLLFGFAAHSIPLSLLGLLQYTAPTINLLIGIFLYHEDFPASRMIGFTLIWGALLLYVGEGVLKRLRARWAVL
jgi:chloramphenicol-sensitive protein RarD